MKQTLASIAVLVTLSGCAGMLDPYERAGTWRITGINDDNLRAMVGNPLDLQRGAEARDAMGQTAAVAVARMRSDTVKDLGSTSLTSVGTQGSGSATGATGAAGSGGPQ